MKRVWSLYLAPGCRALLRDWRSGELTLLVFALVIAVLAVGSVGFLSDRVTGALEHNSAQMLGGDLVLKMDEPVPASVLAQADKLGLQVSLQQTLSTMVSSQQGLRLVSLKAVDSAYPLRGEILLQAAGAESQGLPATHGPAAKKVWIDPQLASLLEISIGSTISLGEASFTVGGIINYEPDRGVQFINFAPRVMMRLDDLPATGLVGPGSRVSYAAAFAGSGGAIHTLRQWLAPQLLRGQHLSEPGEMRPEITGSLNRAHQFLSLVALLTVIIAAVAVALATRRFSRRHRDGVAVMRCLGASRFQLAALFVLEFVLLALCAASLGVVLAFGVQAGLAHWVAVLLLVELPAASWQPVWQGYAAALLLLAGFALPALLTLHRVAPMRVLRQLQDGWAPRSVYSYGAGLLVFFLLAWWMSGDFKISLLVCAGFLCSLIVCYGAAYGCISLLGPAARMLNLSASLRFSLKSLTRRSGLAATQVCALSIGLLVILLLTLTRTDLLDGWRHTLPPDAPNTFLINIQPDQREAVGAMLQAAQMRAAPLAPMVRGRLLSINQVPIDAQRYENERAQRLAQRDFNLSYLSRLPSSNTLESGRWIDQTKNEVSLEVGLAKTLGVLLGDTLTFSVAGQKFDVQVTSLRQVKWDSFEVNFFAVMSRHVLQSAPATFITSFYLPPDQATFAQQLLGQFPNVTVLDVGTLLKQVRRILDQAVYAVQLLFLFTLLAGLLALAAAFAATRDERIHEVAILRVLGASASSLGRMQWVEQCVLGVLSGLLAGAASIALARLLAAYVFEFELGWPWWPWLAGILGGVAIARLGASLALRGVLRTPPLRMLREAV